MLPPAISPPLGCSTRSSVADDGTSVVDDGTSVVESSTGLLISMGSLSETLGLHSVDTSYVICSLLTDGFNCSSDQNCSGPSIASLISFGQCQS